MMDSKHAREIRDVKAEFPEAANARVKALRQLFGWAKDAGHVKANPARDVPYVRRRTSGYHTWTIEEVQRYEERWPLGTKEYLALALMLFTGARRSDAVRLGKGMERAGELTFRQAKTGTEVTVPITPELRAAIDAYSSGHMTYLVTELGKPFTSNGFGNWFADRCKAAGVPGRAHGLRKAGATLLAEGGATAHELMAIYGWANLKEAETYTRKASRKHLARTGMAKMVL
jgi:integrase